MKTVLTIAGSDCSGGAGIQADLKTMMAHGVYGMSVITALTAQNTQGVSSVSKVGDDMVKAQLESVFEDIFPDAVKVGMVHASSTIEIIARILKKYRPRHIVVDSVMVSSSGTDLLEKEAIAMLQEKLLPLATVITPNMEEAGKLAGMQVTDSTGQLQAAKKLSECYPGAVLIKGGHAVDNSDDLLYECGKEVWFPGEKIENPNTHGTGCTLSSAIASNLALGYDTKESVRRAKEYITGAIQAGLNLGKGSGPLKHDWNITTVKQNL